MLLHWTTCSNPVRRSGLHMRCLTDMNINVQMIHAHPVLISRIDHRNLILFIRI
uniref:Uncharacterized protein n=1 Tax=Anguilla anguilla TaxID=7936 RepID=A0A0E9UZW7_ANGAN